MESGDGGNRDHERGIEAEGHCSFARFIASPTATSLLPKGSELAIPPASLHFDESKGFV